jgi:hypothetical protein
VVMVEARRNGRHGSGWHRRLRPFFDSHLRTFSSEALG